MKIFNLKFGMLATMLLATLLAKAYDFETGNLKFTITSMSELEVEVNGLIDIKADKVVVPQTVNFNNRTFTVTAIGENAFHGKSLTDIILPSTIRELKSECFAYCDFSNIILPNSLETIGTQAFRNCIKLSSIIIPPNVKEIGSWAFGYCSALLEVFFLSPEPPSIIGGAFNGTSSYLERYVPSAVEYGFGKEYLSFETYTYPYNKQKHLIQWKNNLKAYKCSIEDTECTTEINAGEYRKILKVNYSDGVDFSVDIPYTYSISKVQLMVVVNDMQREYGDQNPDFTCSISGFVSGDSESTIGTTPSFECSATQRSPVGVYKILASLDAPNYEASYTYGNLSVLPAPITIGIENTTKVYGNPNPDFSLMFTGLKNEELAPNWKARPTILTTATKQSGVGTYPVTIEGGEALNYEVTSYNQGELIITKRDLTAKANDCERLYNEENPIFDISYVGFVNGDTETSLLQKPIAECNATKTSNAGTYPIVVTGGEAENYSLKYQDGLLKIKPLSVGFKEVYNSVTYNDMALSTSDIYFNYIPEIIGPFNEEDFWLELLYLDKDNLYPNMHDITISSGDYAGNYINTNIDRTMWVGKYIFKLTSKGNNPNVTANPSQAFLTVNRTTNNLEWNVESPINVEVGEKVDLGISYQADLWCKFNTEFDGELIAISSENETSNSPHWYATGLKEGETTLYFSIECRKNDMGFYDFTDSKTLSKRIIVSPSSGIEDVLNDNEVTLTVREGTIFISHKNASDIVRVYNLQGKKIIESSDNEVHNLAKGIYIVTIGVKSFKVKI